MLAKKKWLSKENQKIWHYEIDNKKNEIEKKNHLTFFYFCYYLGTFSDQLCDVQDTN